MSRPFLRWLLFAICLAVLLGAMLWMSQRTLELEAQKQRAAEEAQVQERLRLGLWRMDSLASALLIRENARPPSHYQAFYEPEELFANGSSNQVIPKGQALQPSPLFGAPPDLVQLHFELIPGDPLPHSPQAPTGAQGQLASTWYAVTPDAQVVSQKLKGLGELLKRHPEVQKQPRLTETPAPAQKAAADQAKDAKLKEADKEAPQAQSRQLFANAREQNQRSKIVSQNLAIEKAEAYNAPMKKTAPPSAVKPSTRSALDDVADRYRSSESQPSTTASVAAPVPSPPRPAMPTIAGDLRPTWVEKELMLLRRASVDGHERLQGVWLDWPKLRLQLLETVRDLLPAASLIPVAPDIAQNDASALVTLPLRLIPGKVPLDPITIASPLKPALAIAWACVLTAAIAIGLVLHRAMLLSERRGAFVSSVTHELRTPLTTFRLYSEMLAEDMVPDADRRREYLQTLCDESTRLMHLVENVLSYSRIERGRTAARLETLTVGNLLERISPRLRQRADQVQLALQTQLSAEVETVLVAVDAMAVEQILFNLVDNACKYAAPDSDPRELHLQAEATAKFITFTVRDFGPGLSREAKRKLFRPFGKSATEAAHSAPGVGLGLALCRRLARELGGDLRFLPTQERGAQFCLTLKRA